MGQMTRSLNLSMSEETRNALDSLREVGVTHADAFKTALALTRAMDEVRSHDGPLSILADGVEIRKSERSWVGVSGQKKEYPEDFSDLAIAEITKGLQDIREQLSALQIGNMLRAEVDADLKQAEAEISRPAPKRKMLKVFLESLRDNLAKAAGAGVAGAIAILSTILAKHFGLL